MAAKRAKTGPVATQAIFNDHAQAIDDIVGFINAMQAAQAPGEAGTIKRTHFIENGRLEIHEVRTLKVGNA